jgi:hypothetical protein
LSNSIKLQIFQKIQRFMPYDNFEYLHMKMLGDQLKGPIGQPLPEKKGSGFVLNVPEDNFVVPDQIT